MTDLSALSDSELAQIAGVPLPSTGGDDSLSIKNNNPGNMKQGGEFASYDTPKAGLDAMQHDLMLKVSGNSPVMKSQYGEGYQPTLRNVISTWAPSSENNTDGYIKFVSQHAGLDPDAPLTPNDVPKIMSPMIHMEGGQKASQYFGKLMTSLPQEADSGQVKTDAQTDGISSMSDDELMKIAGVQSTGIDPNNPLSIVTSAAHWLLKSKKMSDNAIKGIGTSAENMMNNADNPNYSPAEDAMGIAGGAFGAVTAPITAGIQPTVKAGLQKFGNPEAQNNLEQNADTIASDITNLGASALPLHSSGVIADTAKAGKTLTKDIFGGAPSLAKEVPSLTKMDDGKPLVISPKAIDSAPSKLGDYLAADGIDLNKTADHLEELQKVDPNATVIDAITQGEGDIPGGTNMMGLLKSISQQPGQARTMVAQMISRGRTSAPDIGNLITTSLGGKDYAGLKTQLDADMKAAGQAYDKAYQNPIPMTSPAINDLLARPAGKSALARANTLAANEGSTITNLDGTLTTRGIDYIKRALDDKIGGAGTNQFGKITQAGKSFIEIKNGILDEADRLNPDFAAARAQFADPASQRTALEQGRNFFSMDKHEVADFMKNKTPAERGQFLSGVSEAAQEKIGGITDKTNPINKIWTANNRAKFQALFPDEASYGQFAKAMDLHQVKMNVNQVMSGSPTFQNQAFNEKPVGTALGNGIRAAADPLMFVGGRVADFADKALAKKAATLDGDSKIMIARILTSKDPQALRAIAARTQPTTH
jgi:hypothetical protein